MVARTPSPSHRRTSASSFAIHTNDDGDEVRHSTDLTDAFVFFSDHRQPAGHAHPAISMCAPGDTCDFSTGSATVPTPPMEAQSPGADAKWAGSRLRRRTPLSWPRSRHATHVIAWSGETTYDIPAATASTSISGPNVYVAFQAQQGSAKYVDGISTSGWGHVHTIYRDPSNDYAGSVTQQEGSV